MKREQMRNAIDIDALLQEFASSPQAAAIRQAMKQPCREPAEVEAFCQGKWDEQRAQEFRRHLIGCPTCAQLITQLRHPSEELLLCYANNHIPIGPAGTLLRERLAWHLRACDTCRMQVEQATLEILHWATLQRTLERIGRVQQLVNALASASQAAPRRMAPIGGRGARLSAGETIEALVFDATGRLVVDAQGEPDTVRFDVRHAEIDRQRELVVRLSTTDEPYCRPGSAPATVQIALQHAAQRLCFRPVPIRPRLSPTRLPVGMVVLQESLGVATETLTIPADALRLTVHLSSDTRGESTHGHMSSVQHR
jgi:hypothetical protein